MRPWQFAALAGSGSRRRQCAALLAALACAAAASAQPLTDRRVEASGTTVRLRCGGERRPGTPTVLLEAGAFNTVDTWRDVQGPIAAFARVCADDRPGRGESGSAPPGLDARGYVRLLSRALEAAGERPPFVLVGHSLGGLIAQLYAAERPADVAGVVLVDSSHPDQVRRFAALPRPAPPPATSRPQPPPEAVSLDAFADALHHAPPRFAVPLVVLSRSRWTAGPDGPDDRARLALWMDLQRDLAAQASRARHVVAPDSGHYVQNDAPSLVVDAVRELAGGDAQAAGAATDLAPVRRVVDDYVGLYRKDALAEWRGLFLPSFTATSPAAGGGVTVRTLDEFFGAQARGFERAREMSETLEHVTISRSGRIATAWADFVFHQDGSSRRGRLVLGLIETGGGWRIASLLFSY